MAARLRLCFVGDSYVNGTGDPDGLGWIGRICRNAFARGHDVTFYDLGIRGETTADVRRRWRAECEARLPADDDGRLVFAFGLNDTAEIAGAGRRLAEAESLAEARAMMTEAAGWRPTLWVGPPPANEAMSPMTPLPGFTISFANERILCLNAAFAALAAELGIAYLDVASPLSADPVYLDSQRQGDGLHCGARGYGRIADLFEAWPAWRAWLP